LLLKSEKSSKINPDKMGTQLPLILKINMARRSAIDTYKVELIDKLMKEMSTRPLHEVETPDLLSELTKLLNKPEPKPTKEEQAIADKETKSMELSKKLAKRMSQNGI
jgi:hypothetical protein